MSVTEKSGRRNPGRVVPGVHQFPEWCGAGSANALSMSATAAWAISTMKLSDSSPNAERAARHAVDLFSFNLGFRQERSGIIRGARHALLIEDDESFCRNIVEVS
jgi:hypothetical protein